MGLDVELRGQPEVPLPSGREADVRADASDPERPRRVTVEVVADDVPDALVEEQGIGIETPLRLAFAGR